MPQVFRRGSFGDTRLAQRVEAGPRFARVGRILVTVAG
jgi:hypothetical protein